MAAYITFQPKDYFSTVLYTATGSSLGVTGVGFQPDLTWIKNRDAADFHVLTDAVRGVTKYWQSNDTAAEVTNAESLKSFDSDGFTVGTQAEVNTNTEDYVSWNWKAGTTTGIAGSPTITPTSYSFNATSGFSIIKYDGDGSSGATVPHGLGVAPKMIIVKATVTTPWAVYQDGVDATASEDYYLVLNTNAARSDSDGRWSDTAPGTSLFTLGNDGTVNDSSRTYIAYCFAEKKGYSNFGSYTGNGNVDGPFIYTGFRPAYIMFKKTNAVGEWVVYDTKRLGYNGANSYLEPSTTDDDDGNDQMDFLANGVKIRNPGSYSNTSAGSYIYAAFSEFPIVSSNDIPGTAR